MAAEGRKSLKCSRPRVGTAAALGRGQTLTELEVVVMERRIDNPLVLARKVFTWTFLYAVVFVAAVDMIAHG
jgi:hypothetical protein